MCGCGKDNKRKLLNSRLWNLWRYSFDSLILCFRINWTGGSFAINIHESKNWKSVEKWEIADCIVILNFMTSGIKQLWWVYNRGLISTRNWTRFLPLCTGFMKSNITWRGELMFLRYKRARIFLNYKIYNITFHATQKVEHMFKRDISLASSTTSTALMA